MATTGYRLYDAEGSLRAGDPQLDNNMKSYCDELHGHIEDLSGAVVYDARIVEED